MTIGCNIRLICLKTKLIFVAISSICMGVTFFGMRRLKQFSPYRRNDRSKISSDQKRFFIALSLNPLSFFANTSFKYCLFDDWKIV